MDKDKYTYAFNFNNYDADNSYANLPNHNNHNNSRQSESQQFQVHHYEPKGPPSMSTQHNSNHNSQDLVSTFTDLAHSVNVKLNEELTK